MTDNNQNPGINSAVDVAEGEAYEAGADAMLKALADTKGGMSFRLDNLIVLSPETKLLLSVAEPGEVPWYLAQFNVVEDSCLTSVFVNIKPLEEVENEQV